MITDSKTASFLAYRHGIKLTGWNPYVRSARARELPCYMAGPSIKWSNELGGEGYLHLRGGGLYQIKYLLRYGPLFVHQESMHILKYEPELYTSYILGLHIGKNGQKANNEYIEFMKKQGMAYVEPD